MEKTHFLDRALHYESVMDTYGLSQVAFAKKIGVAQSTVANHLRMLTLPESLQEMIRESDLKVKHIRELLRLRTEEDQTEAFFAACKDKMSVEELKDLVDRFIAHPEKRGKRRAFGLFIKSINWAVRSLTDKKMEVKVSKRESDDHIDINIRIKK